MTAPVRRSFLYPQTSSQDAGVVSFLLLNGVVGAAYAVTGYVGLKLAFVAHAATLFWPPSGIAFAALWLGGPRLAPAVLMAAFCLNLTVFGSPYPALLVALGNLLPGLAARFALQRILKRWDDLGELPKVLAFIFVACLGTTLLSASFGAITVRLAGAPNAAMSATWIVWWMGDAMGVLIAAPPILLAGRLLTSRFQARVAAEAAAFAFLALAAVAGLLMISKPLWALELCKLSTFLLILWAGARFGLLGPAAVTVVMAIGSVAATSLGVGPFAQGDFYDRFVLVHSYLFAESAAGLLFAAALEDLKLAVQREQAGRDAIQRAYADRIALLNMLNHDVRTPLSGMMGVLQALFLSHLSREQRQSVSLGLRAGSSLTNLINDLLDVTRVDAGRIQLTRAPFSLSECLNDLVDLVRPTAEVKALEVVLEIETALPPRVLGDRTRLEQILGNLLTNAVSYTHEGRVRLQARWDERAAALHVEIIDTGPGIAGVVTSQDLFAERGLTDQASSGLGLGLHICRKLVALMGGVMTYRGGEGRGSHFSLTLPFILEAIFTEGGGAHGGDTAQHSKILLVEDDEIAREASRALLQSLGHRVIAVSEAAQALEMVQGLRFDIVLMDVNLAHGDASGLDLARAIRRLPTPAANLPIIALTGSADETLASALKAAGVNVVWIKPLDLTKLAHLLHGCDRNPMLPVESPARVEL